jgi:gluconolactonase
MTTRAAAAALAAVLVFVPAGAQAACEDLLEQAQPALVASGFRFTEGPAWSPQGYFVFSDIPADTIYRLDGSKKPQPWRKPSGYANGNAFDALGNHWSARHDRRVTRTSPAGETVVAAQNFQGGKLNSPNDLAIDAAGAVWFTDPPFGLQGNGPQVAPEEQKVRGVYRITGGTLELMAGDLKLPNGIAFSRDYKKLYVAEGEDGWVYQFDVQPSGALAAKQRFVHVAPMPGQPPMVDGIKVDRAGRLWMTGPGKLGVFAPDGAQLCVMPVGGGAHLSNLAFGGQDGRSILLTVTDKVMLLRSRMPLR